MADVRIQNLPTAAQDDALDLQIASLLRAGMLLSAAVVLLGGVLFLVHHGREVPDYHTFHGVAGLTSIPAIVKAAFTGEDIAIIQLGLLLLIATPVMRVVLAVVGFAREHDLLYAGIAALVLVVLLYSLLVH